MLRGLEGRPEGLLLSGRPLELEEQEGDQQQQRRGWQQLVLEYWARETL